MSNDTIKTHSFGKSKFGGTRSGTGTLIDLHDDPEEQSASKMKAANKDLS